MVYWENIHRGLRTDTTLCELCFATVLSFFVSGLLTRYTLPPLPPLTLYIYICLHLLIVFVARLSLPFQVRFTCSRSFFSWNKNHCLLFLVAKRPLLITLTVRPFVCVYICASMPDMTIGLFSPIAPRSTCITSILASSKYISARAFV